MLFDDDPTNVSLRDASLKDGTQQPYPLPASSAVSYTPPDAVPTSTSPAPEPVSGVFRAVQVNAERGFRIADVLGADSNTLRFVVSK